jgi:hypothetical protein
MWLQRVMRRDAVVLACRGSAAPCADWAVDPWTEGPPRERMLTPRPKWCGPTTMWCGPWVESCVLESCVLRLESAVAASECGTPQVLRLAVCVCVCLFSPLV